LRAAGIYAAIIQPLLLEAERIDNPLFEASQDPTSGCVTWKFSIMYVVQAWKPRNVIASYASGIDSSPSMDIEKLEAILFWIGIILSLLNSFGFDALVCSHITLLLLLLKVAG
jgi:hypothetical protein